MRGALKAVFALTLLLAACSPAARLAPPRVDPTPEVRGGDAALQAKYEASLKRWTRRAELYDRLDARLFFAGTLLSPSFREALEARDAALGLTPSPLLAPKADESAAPTVLLGVYAHDDRFDGFSGNQRLWQITLSTSQGTLRPEKIRRISRPDHWLRTSFPYLDRFWSAYLVTFPVQEQAGGGAHPFPWDEAIFNIQSVAGSITLNFQTDEPDKSAAQAH